jgi:hypothetical protein
VKSCLWNPKKSFDFEQCREMCRDGIARDASDAAKSQLEEWRAIAQAQLGFPPEFVRSAFDEAVHLDPTNELARRNLDAFEASLGVPHSNSMWEHKSEAVVRQFGLAEGRNLVAA